MGSLSRGDAHHQARDDTALGFFSLRLTSLRAGVPHRNIDLKDFVIRRVRVTHSKIEYWRS